MEALVCVSTNVASVLILKHGHTLLVSTALDPVNCIDVGAGQRVVQVDPSVSCNDPSYDSHIWFSYMSLFTYAVVVHDVSVSLSAADSRS